MPKSKAKAKAVVPKPTHRDTSLKRKRVVPAKMAKVFQRKTVRFNLTHSQNQAIKRNPKKSACEAQLRVQQRAKEVQANLSPQFPSLLKCMLPSHVTGGFWLGLPTKFCQLHLPKVDTVIVLEDESGELYETKYLAAKVGLSGGWRAFSIAHNLLVMDVLIFHLVRPSKFKVYIIRSQGLDEVDGALSLLKLENGRKEKKDYKVHQVDDTLDYSAVTGEEGNDAENNCKTIFSDVNMNIPQPEANDGIRFAESEISFKEVTGIENFSIQVNGLVIDSEFSKHIRGKYYKLCWSQKSFLHEHLIEDLNCKLVAGIICETINIADGIRASKFGSESEESFVLWDKTLNAFEGMGMKVRFLINRLHQLMKLNKNQRLEALFHDLANAPW